MGCLDSVPDDSAEGRARAFEDKLKLNQWDCDQVKSAFFLLNDGEHILSGNLAKGWENLKDKGIPLVLGDEKKKARDEAWATFAKAFAVGDDTCYASLCYVLFFCSNDGCAKKWKNMADTYSAFKVNNIPLNQHNFLPRVWTKKTSQKHNSRAW